LPFFKGHDRKRQNMPTNKFFGPKFISSSETMVSDVSVLAVTGYWRLAAGLWLLDTAHLFLAACLRLGQEQEASCQKPSQVPDT
jgi:hypothetical protein